MGKLLPATWDRKVPFGWAKLFPQLAHYRADPSHAAENAWLELTAKIG